MSQQQRDIRSYDSWTESSVTSSQVVKEGHETKVVQYTSRYNKDIENEHSKSFLGLSYYFDIALVLHILRTR